jgi:hypothetical protein
MEDRWPLHILRFKGLGVELNIWIYWLLNILRSEVKSQTGQMNIMTSQYFENPFLDIHQTLYTVHLTKLITLMGFEQLDASIWKFKGETGHKIVLTTQYLDNPLLDGHQILYTGTSWLLDDPWFKGQTGHRNIILTTQYLDNPLFHGH